MYLHSIGMVHGDIKDENILVDHDYQIKLIDFGSAIMVQPDELVSAFKGTLHYASPQILNGERYSPFAADIWTLGCLLYVLVAGEVPFSRVATAKLGQFQRPRFVSIECEDLISKMLKVNVDERATMTEISQHPWMISPSASRSHRT
jgi:PAS domain-containing serine/threonine kinase